MSTINPVDMRSLADDPVAIVAAINDRLDQIHLLDGRHEELTGRSVAGSVPQSVADVVPPANTGPVYGPGGVTAPREDGAVRVKSWDDFISNAATSAEESNRRWAAERAKQPWIFIQDTLLVPGINRQQRHNIGTNCANSRMLSGFVGGVTYKGWSWPAFPVVYTAEGALRLGEDAIDDAFAVSDDLVALNGTVKSKGYRVADLPSLAVRSLAHFVLTSGRSTAPLGSHPFGRGK